MNTVINTFYLVIVAGSYYVTGQSFTQLNQAVKAIQSHSQAASIVLVLK